MPELPLLKRELTAFGKRPFFFALRAAPACFALAFGLLAIMSGVGDLSPAQFEGFGAFIANACLAFQYAIALVGAPLWAAGSITKEREQRTLPLLILADFRGGDILLAKFAAAFGAAALLCCATAPLLVMAATGRIALEAVVFATAHSVVLAAFGAALGVYGAIRRGGEANGARVAIALIVAYSLSLHALARAMFAMEAPFPFLFWSHIAFLDFTPAAPFVLAVCLPLLFSALVLGLAHRRLPFAIESVRPAAVRALRRASISNAPPAAQKRILLRRIWMGRDWAVRGRIGLIAANLELFAIAVIPFIGNAVVAAVLAYRLCARNVRLLESPMIDELRLTHDSDAAFQKALFKTMIQGWAGRGMLFLGALGILIALNPTYYLTLDRDSFMKIAPPASIFVAACALLAIWQSLCLSAAAAAYSCSNSSIAAKVSKTMLLYGVAKILGYIVTYMVLFSHNGSSSGAVLNFLVVSTVPLAYVFATALAVFEFGISRRLGNETESAPPSAPPAS